MMYPGAELEKGADGLGVKGKEKFKKLQFLGKNGSGEKSKLQTEFLNSFRLSKQGTHHGTYNLQMSKRTST